jgi:hypothetical protein
MQMQGESMKKADSRVGPKPAQLITNQIAELGDWRGRMLARLRKLILEADRTREGLVCSAGAFKDHVKLNFFKGTSLKDPKGMFNAGLDAKNTRAIDFSEGDSIDASALKDLIRAAVAHNVSTEGKR